MALNRVSVSDIEVAMLKQQAPAQDVITLDDVKRLEKEDESGNQLEIRLSEEKRKLQVRASSPGLASPQTESLHHSHAGTGVESASVLEKENRVMISTDVQNFQGSGGSNEIVLEAIGADEFSSSEDEMDEAAVDSIPQASDISSDEQVLQAQGTGLEADEVSDISSADIDIEPPVQETLPLGSPIISSDDDYPRIKETHKQKKKKRREKRKAKQKRRQSATDVASDIASDSSINYLARQPSVPSSERSANEENRSGVEKKSFSSVAQSASNSRTVSPPAHKTTSQPLTQGLSPEEIKRKVSSLQPLQVISSPTSSGRQEFLVFQANQDVETVVFENSPASLQHLSVASKTCEQEEKLQCADEETDERPQVSSPCSNPGDINDCGTDKESAVKTLSVVTLSNSLRIKWMQSVEGKRADQNMRSPLKTWTEMADVGKRVNQTPDEINDPVVQDENINTLNMGNNSSQTPNELHQKLESLKDVCKNDQNSNNLKGGVGVGSSKRRKRRKERRERKRATPLPPDSSSDEESDFNFHPKKRKAIIKSSSEEDLARKRERRREGGEDVRRGSVEAQDEGFSSLQKPIKLIIKNNQISERVEGEKISVKQLIGGMLSDRLFQRPFVELRRLSSSKIERRSKCSVQEIYKEAGMRVRPGSETPEVNTNVILEQAPLLETVKSEKKRFACSLCDQVFDKHEERHQHYLMNHTEKPKAQIKLLSCSICQRQFSEYNQRHEHYMSGNCKKAGENLKKTFKCAFCDEKFKDTEERSAHYLLEHLQKKDIPKKSFQTRDITNKVRICKSINPRGRFKEALR